MNAVDWLLERHVREGRADRPCLHDEERMWTYGEVGDLTARAGAVFADAGVGKGERVLVILPDTVATVAVILGLIRIGAVPVPVSPRLPRADYQRMLADCRPRAMVVTSQLAKLEGPELTWLAGGDGTGVRSLDAELASAKDAADVTKTSPGDVALIQYTSGSTGTPRGVLHQHQALTDAPRGLIERLQLNADDVCLSASKLTFGYGFGNSVLVPMTVGASSVLTRSPAEPGVLAQRLRRNEPTVFFGVPTLYATLLGEREAASRFPLRNLRAYVSSGEYLGERLGRSCLESFGPGLVNAFGCTEALYAFMSTEPGGWEPESLGRPYSGYEIQIADADADGVGQLCVRGPGVAEGYLGDPPEAVRTFDGSWVRTGDWVSERKGGGLRYLGRSDDLLMVGGAKVAPWEVEEAIARHPGVSACVVVGTPDEYGLTSMVACVVRAGSDSPSAGELRRHIRASLPPGHRPSVIEFLDEFPRTSTGKVSRSALRAAARDAGRSR